MTATLVFPHQLFARHPGLAKSRPVLLVEDQLFFGDHYYPARFHVHKLVFHRATMQTYAARLRRHGFDVRYVEYARGPGMPALDTVAQELQVSRVVVAELDDYILEKRLRRLCARLGISLDVVASPAFLSPAEWLEERLAHQAHFAMTPFYQAQRKRLDVLMVDGKPAGGKWTYDTDNRQRLPRGITIPALPVATQTRAVKAARAHVQALFPGNPGADQPLPYPVSHAGAERWLSDFLVSRLPSFGPYEDAIARHEPFLFHSVLSPLINTGLLTPRQVLDRTLAYAHEHGPIALNCLEGFVRQLIGWREFMRGVYRFAGVRQRTTNALANSRPMPPAFYSGTTGIEPVDTVIARVLQHAYCHHIERLMVLGNFMLLCDINPDDVYRWFMELFIDAYDWVMVPNVYGMSQYADGGLMTTKPYISSSNYIRKMSDFPRGDWCAVWDGLYWRFIHRHRDVIAANPRMGMMARQLERMAPERLRAHLNNAEQFLGTL
jgi:deoxyribodipyrimidine photolyase-related protein